MALIVLREKSNSVARHFASVDAPRMARARPVENPWSGKLKELIHFMVVWMEVESFGHSRNSSCMNYLRGMRCTVIIISYIYFLHERMW